jgi:hypothetical protein
LLVAPARSVCANAGTAVNRQPIETRARSINLSVSGSLRNDGRSFTDDALDLTILRNPDRHVHLFEVRSYTGRELNGKVAKSDVD